MKKFYKCLLFVALLVAAAFALGVGPYYGDSAVQELRAELAEIYGEPYTDREADIGLETLEFIITSDTVFPTKPWVRRFFGWDYRYKCTVIRSVYEGDRFIEMSIYKYDGIDPIGRGKETDCAYLDMSSKESSFSIA